MLFWDVLNLLLIWRSTVPPRSFFFCTTLHHFLSLSSKLSSLFVICSLFFRPCSCFMLQISFIWLLWIIFSWSSSLHVCYYVNILECNLLSRGRLKHGSQSSRLRFNRTRTNDFCRLSSALRICSQSDVEYLPSGPSLRVFKSLSDARRETHTHEGSGLIDAPHRASLKGGQTGRSSCSASIKSQRQQALPAGVELIDVLGLEK